LKGSDGGDNDDDNKEVEQKASTSSGSTHITSRADGSEEIRGIKEKKVLASDAIGAEK
jgi:hypothetical protein